VTFNKSHSSFGVHLPTLQQREGSHLYSMGVMPTFSSMLSALDPTILSWRMVGATIAAIFLPILLTWLYVIRHIRNKPHRKHVAMIIVLGDMGRSPRMMYHASSFARHEWEAVLVGYDDTPLMPSLLETPHIHPRAIASPPKFVMRLPWIIRAPVRIIYQVVSVLNIALFTLPIHPEVIMVQNPPSIPTLALACFITHFTKAKLIIDWHNTGYSILAMRTGEQSILVTIAKWFESYFGRRAYAHLFVTKALEKFLANEWALE
jgi:beta-1,4-mannosyltransferase